MSRLFPLWLSLTISPDSCLSFHCSHLNLSFRSSYSSSTFSIPHYHLISLREQDSEFNFSLFPSLSLSPRFISLPRDSRPFSIHTISLIPLSLSLSRHISLSNSALLQSLHSFSLSLSRRTSYFFLAHAQFSHPHSSNLSPSSLSPSFQI